MSTSVAVAPLAPNFNVECAADVPRGGASNGINFASPDPDIYPTLRLGV